MELTRYVDAYCERIAPHYWAEPVNALTNLAFVMVAVLVWLFARQNRAPMTATLCMIEMVIGLGSYLFHTHAQVWALWADILPIAIFVLVYVFAINRDILGLRRVRAYGLTALFFPYYALTLPMFQMLPGLGSSAVYGPVPLLILLYAVVLWGKQPVMARGFAIGAAILVLSLTLRTLDEPLCPLFPMGTHFLWHVLNGGMLGWMIVTYARAWRVQSSEEMSPTLAGDAQGR
ncbi:ceramidase [Epibacterium ulvae]|uniref:ceramidase domain-containing protein n=1 Tax=Epibacterium ulvae TaxID=1156985 RepID=UPI001BFC3DB5|nr:ceramidase domain-containing protein [Epibacterium ulvae]MBT8154477.1 ceramidase [Epibacterium ulvae]